MEYQQTQRSYGWKPQLPDHRDFQYSNSLMVARQTTVLPKSVNLEPLCPPVYDQAEFGSCTGNMTAFMVDFVRHKQGLPFMNPSRLFAYYNARTFEGTTGTDSGASIRDVIKGANQYGVCPESIWSYTQANLLTKPSKVASINGATHKATSYFAVKQDLNEMKTCLSAGFPFGIGISVYESFESDEVAKTGIVPVPTKSESQIGGHAVAVIGYNDVTSTFSVRNSWGPLWGKNGYFTIGYAYLLNPNLASDFWTIHSEQ